MVLLRVYEIVDVLVYAVRAIIVKQEVYLRLQKFAQQDDMVAVPPDLVAVLAQGPARQVTTALLVH
jgi:hypothetical protein